MKILIVDIDEVLLDWSKSFDKFIREKYNYDGIFIGESPLSLPDLLNNQEDEISEIMLEHTRQPSFRELEYKNDAYILQEYKNNFDKIIAITSCGKDDYIKEARDINISERFPNIIDEIIYLDFLEEKTEVLENLIKQYPDAEFYMIDDNIDNINAALNLGINACAYKTAFNKTDKVSYVVCLKDFFESFLKL